MYMYINTKYIVIFFIVVSTDHLFLCYLKALHPDLQLSTCRGRPGAYDAKVLTPQRRNLMGLWGRCSFEGVKLPCHITDIHMYHLLKHQKLYIFQHNPCTTCVNSTYLFARHKTNSPKT